LIISYSHRFIFIHIPRTAGTSIQTALAPYAHCVERHWMNRALELVGIRVNHFAPHPWKRFRGHVTAAQLRSHLPSEVFEDLFKFAFVRNPWDLMVSYYHYLLCEPRHHRHQQVRRIESFEAYVEYMVRRNRFPQTRYVTGAKGHLLVDFVGRFESLRADFGYVCRRLGLTLRLPHVNQSAHRDYRTYYSDRSAELVATHFRRDIERFGYTFDGVPAAWAA
jgi:hypothetical protein